MEKSHASKEFRRRILHITPLESRRQLALEPMTCGLYLASIGWFPRIQGDYWDRPQGSEENIMIHCRAGRGWMEIDGREQEVSAGDVILIPRGKPHRYGTLNTDPWSTQWAHFEGEEAAAYSRAFEELGCKVALPSATRVKLELLFGDCLNAFKGEHAYRAHQYAAHAFRHLLGLLRFKIPLIQNGANALPAQHDVTASVAYMKASLARRLTLPDMARQAGLSISRYSILFKKQVGMPPVEYHIHLRIQAAGRLLLTTSLTVKDICNRLGFEDPYYFSRLFRKTIGVSPVQYRAGVKGQ